DVFDTFAQTANLINAAVTGGIDFQHVQRAAFSNFLTAIVLIVEVSFWAAGAVEAFCENASDSCFASAARAAKEVSMSDAFLLDRAGQCLGDMLLADDVFKALRTVLTGYDLVTHFSAEFGNRRAEVWIPHFCNLHLRNQLAELCI